MISTYDSRILNLVIFFPLVVGALGARVTPTVGAVSLTATSKVASLLAPNLSVARIVIVCDPIGAAPLIETTPVVLLTEIVPV